MTNGLRAGRMPAVELRAQARDAARRRDWQTVDDTLRGCGDLTADDHVLLAQSAHWLGRSDDAIASYREAYRLHRDAGAVPRAALAAFMLAVFLRLRGDVAEADGWLARAQRLLAPEAEGAEHGYPLYLETARLMGADPEAARRSARRMQDLGRRFGDDTLLALGTFFEGRALVKVGRVAQGLALLDEAMVAALSDELEPMWTGAIYCGLLDACHELIDLRRAREWTEATRRWCEPMPVASLYSGMCRVHTVAVLDVQGRWAEAEAEALDVCRDMAGTDRFVVADAFYEVAELRRRRGEIAGAAEAYERSHELGRDPQPGLALLRLAQGRVAAAGSSIAAALAAVEAPLDRAPLLAARVEIALTADDVPVADAAATELVALASRFCSAGLGAVAHRSRGMVALAQGRAVVALAALRAACTTWQQVDAPYEAARTRVLLAEAYDALDDADAAERERTAARVAFERLGAEPDLRGLDPDGPPAHGLTAREVEVLRLVAEGRTNREIADALVISERTVARHVSNVFTKLAVSSRAGATAFAYSHDLVGTPPGR